MSALEKLECSRTRGGDHIKDSEEGIMTPFNRKMCSSSKDMCFKYSVSPEEWKVESELNALSKEQTELVALWLKTMVGFLPGLIYIYSSMVFLVLNA